MQPKKKLSVNVGNSTLYIEIYDKTNPENNLVNKDCWKLGDSTWELHKDNYIELVYTGDTETGWEPTPSSLITGVISHFFKDIYEACDHVVRVLNNDPEFDETVYLNKEKLSAQSNP